MKRYLSLFLMISLVMTVVHAQISPNKYFVKFTDKNNSPYSINNPSDYLSQRAIDRRNKQNIPVEISDLPVNPAYLAGVAATGATILNPTKWFNGVTIYTTDPAVLTAISSLPYVQGITKSSVKPADSPEHEPYDMKPFFKYEEYNQPVPAKVKSGTGWSDYNYGPSLNQIMMLRGDEFHALGYRGEGMVIAVLDAGFTNTHTHPVFDSLWQNNQILGTRDFVAGGEVTFNDHTHGTMVLSCMGSNYPEQLIGTAPKASYWLLRSEDGATEYIIEEYNWVSAAEFADSVGADVINSSLGYTVFDDPSQNHTYADMDGNTTPITNGADMAAQKGILVVNSLGNYGGSSWYYLGAPSDGDSVMGIGAVDPGGNLAGFSSRGPSYDGRVKPDVVAQGSGVYVADPYGSFTWGGGTSFSSPILAGMAACLWQANPTYNNMQVADAIRKSASQYLSPDDMLGYGIPDFIVANSILTIIDAFQPESFLVHIYPNPVRDEINLRFSSQQVGSKAHALITDITGRVVAVSEFNVLPGEIEKLNMPDNMPAGIYLLKLTVEKKEYNFKIIKR
ncbi:MAG: S8 family serine peptidase [Bacteroidales bacterium]|nr:S8 family serine peptidase [Bacteroidales bacterium]